MNCPSRTDETTLEHPDWNQNPPFLAPDLTTCEDLNGKVNAREHRRGTQGAGDGSDGRGDAMNYHTLPRLHPDRRAAVSGGWTSGSHPRNKSVYGGDDHTRLLPSLGSPDSARSSLQGWLSWLLSVIGCSAIISTLKSPEAVVAFVAQSRRSVPVSVSDAVPVSVSDAVPAAASASASILKRSARVARRSTCPTGGLDDEDNYNTPLHVGALFIILAVSFLACAFPIIASRLPGLRIPRPFFFSVRHFGTGVLLATAFVHLLPTAFTLLGNQCLSSFWVTDYPAMPGAIALAGIFLVTIIEMVFHPSRQLSNAQQENSVLADDRPVEMAPAHGSRHSMSRQLSRVVDSSPAAADEVLAKRVDEESRAAPNGGSSSPASSVVALSPAQQHQKDILQCMMLEVGILFHSVFIGMTLSVSVGHEFVILLVAIAFHQTFEGLALGSRIANIAWPEGSLQPWMMALAYGCTTPVGQAIGLATHRLYSPDSEFGLILVGTMNAISSGLLVFAALIELLAEDFLSDESWRVLRGRKRVYACLLVFFGAFGMSLVGAWA
ncbi:plasma membrane zinc ion [Colletotrichum musicola]|uniref:Plasma membrane zinc ion n=1 Tax=Colletotrichum musicola TaxID=2175873 RepID=A0A8H6NDS8_9PEZI|nr:plasma membrane zinc ion [Colletotrichum musicola]